MTDQQFQKTDVNVEESANVSDNSNAFEENEQQKHMQNELENVELTSSEETQNHMNMLVEDVDKIIAERDEFLNDLKRLQAEFDNYRKRVQRERLEMKDYLLQDLMTRLLDVVESLERALLTDIASGDLQAYRTGVEITQNQLMSILKDQGLSRIETVGQPFDPNLHEAVQMVETDEREPGTILLEFSPGYILKDRVLKAPKVQVAKGLTTQTESE